MSDAWHLEPNSSDTSQDCLCSDISGSSQATCVSPVLTVSVCCNVCLQARIAADLIELRNKSVFAFFMFNALFVLIVFLLQLNKDMLHVDWPLGVKTNITYIEETAEVKTRQWVTTSVQSSTNGYRLFWSGLTDSALVKSGLIWSLMIKPGIIWLNLMWYSKCGLVWSGLVIYVVCPNKPLCDLAETNTGCSGLSRAKKGQSVTFRWVIPVVLINYIIRKMY